MGKNCKYKFKDETYCKEQVENGSDLCFWHNPVADKTGSGIKKELENK